MSYDHNSTDRSKLGIKILILTNKGCITVTTIITSATFPHVIVAIDTVNNTVIKIPTYKPKDKKKNMKQYIPMLLLKYIISKK
jgi:hypothetical protein